MDRTIILMTHIHLISIAKTKHCEEEALCKRYIKRLPWRVTQKTFFIKQYLEGEKRRNAEAQLLLNAIPSQSIVIAMDEHGKAFSSEDFSKQISLWQQESSQLAFLIGGADGHGKAILERANLTMQLSKMTFPHLLAKALLMEQLYRAHSLLSGHPYHRE